MVELPLVVWREAEVDWFGDREALTEGLLWAEKDAEFRSEAARLSADLRDNLFGPRIWNLMEPATRTFLASAEAVVRARREDPVFDFSGAAVEYAKALETEVNAIVPPLVRRALEDRRPCGAPGARGRPGAGPGPAPAPPDARARSGASSWTSPS